jgi:hypothetical protein
VKSCQRSWYRPDPERMTTLVMRHLFLTACWSPPARN